MAERDPLHCKDDVLVAIQLTLLWFDRFDARAAFTRFRLIMERLSVVRNHRYKQRLITEYQHLKRDGRFLAHLPDGNRLVFERGTSPKTATDKDRVTLLLPPSWPLTALVVELPTGVCLMELSPNLADRTLSEVLTSWFNEPQCWGVISAAARQREVKDCDAAAMFAVKTKKASQKIKKNEKTKKMGGVKTQKRAV